MQPDTPHRRPRPSSQGWNELDFLDWTEFRQMGPTIVGLEIGRVGELLAAGDHEGPVRDSMIRARFELKKFAEKVSTSTRETPIDELANHLRTAIVNLGISSVELTDADRETVDYVVDRLQYVSNRMRLIY